MDILAGGKGDASNERDYHPAVQYRPHHTTHDTLP